MNKPSISVGIPTYNHGRVLHRALASLEAQSEQPFEIFISDNASSDNTQEVVKEWAPRLSHMHYIKQPRNIGAMANMLFLAEACTGDYVLWLAADDVLKPDCINTIKCFLQRNPECEMVGWAHSFYNYATSSSFTGSTFAEVTLTKSHYQNSYEFLQSCISSYFYSLFKREYLVNSSLARWHKNGKSFDWMDCAFVLDSLLTLKAEFLHADLAIYGIDSEIRPIKTPQAEVAPAGYKYRGNTWLVESLKLICLSVNLTVKEKVLLAVRCWKTCSEVTKHAQMLCKAHMHEGINIS